MLAVKSYTLEILLNWKVMLFKKFYLEKGDHNSEGFVTLNRLLKILAIYLKKENNQIFSEYPANDLVIGENLIKCQEIFSMEEIKSLILDYSKSKTEKAISDRYEYMHTFMYFVTDVLQIRYSNKTYEFLSKRLTVKNIREIINVNPYDLRVRGLMIEFFDTLHVDIKDHLIDEREKYFLYEPKINKYDEDIVVNIENYKLVFIFILEELDFIASEYDHFENDLMQKKYFYDYVYNGILGVIAKLSNFCLTLTDSQLNPFIAGLLKNFILINFNFFLRLP